MLRVLAVYAVVLAAFDVLIWHDVIANRAPKTVARESRGVSRVISAISEPATLESVGVPIRIRIPSIAVDAAIEKVSLAKDGTMDVPKDPLDTAWFEPGARPGEAGSAAIAGHVNKKNGTAAVFADLRKVKTGDKIEVLDDKGAVISFVVRKRRRYDAAADATDVFSSNDGKSHLNIITCDGVLDEVTKQYKERLVVFTDRETE